LLIYNVSKARKRSRHRLRPGPPAADFGTASPCGGRPYGGPAAAARPASRTLVRWSLL